jgi:hypothetical protein
LQCHGTLEGRRADAQFCSRGCQLQYQRRVSSESPGKQ